MQQHQFPVNKYYICLKGNQEPIPWLTPNFKQTFNIDCSLDYFSEVFRIMEKNLGVGGLTFYLVWDNLEQLPSYGQNVVAVVLGDEYSCIPKYIYRVRAVFKCYGVRPSLKFSPYFKLSFLNLMILLQFVRFKVAGFPLWLNYIFYNLRNLLQGKAKIFSIYDIPLGYYKQLDLPVKDIEARTCDIFFDGSLVNKTFSRWQLRYWINLPKAIIRKEMMSALVAIREKYPKVNVDINLIQNFGLVRLGDGEEYSQKMMNSRICVIPRGSTLETYRFFEALRYGCIVVTQGLPSRWFYNGSPAILLSKWSELEEVLKKIISDKDFMKKKHQESLNWWKTKCSETAVGEYIAQQLNRTRPM